MTSSKALLRTLAVFVPLALLSASCGDDESDGDKPPAQQSIPAGVAEQYTVLEAEIAANGGSATAGDYRVGYIVEAAEPWFQVVDGKQVNRPPAPGETHHIEIIPMEASTGRIVPDVPIRLEVIGPDGAVVQGQNLNFYYAPFFHYANNFSVPDGTYTLRATLQPPTFLRHGGSGEKPALSEGATVTFENVQLKPEG
ncbi:hypothetical protein [Nocardia mexicana]|uniref:Lipoprotein n=1 Tax=Nocardia mexicana TaxID=279262 RepID=A0A370HEV1_9NOCA|nr:hypothetical protein [Nocardia mexicana]RDI55774.1 hypothetical protein DFR68_101608 [Nocardia mexicana]